MRQGIDDYIKVLDKEHKISMNNSVNDLRKLVTYYKNEILRLNEIIREVDKQYKTKSKANVVLKKKNAKRDWDKIFKLLPDSLPGLTIPGIKRNCAIRKIRFKNEIVLSNKLKQWIKDKKVLEAEGKYSRYKTR